MCLILTARMIPSIIIRRLKSLLIPSKIIYIQELKYLSIVYSSRGRQIHMDIQDLHHFVWIVH